MTKIQELLKLESDLTQMFDSDQRVAMALLEFIRENRSSLLQNVDNISDGSERNVTSLLK